MGQEDKKPQIINFSDKYESKEKLFIKDVREKADFFRKKIINLNKTIDNIKKSLSRSDLYFISFSANIKFIPIILFREDKELKILSCVISFRETIKYRDRISLGSSIYIEFFFSNKVFNRTILFKDLSFDDNTLSFFEDVEESVFDFSFLDEEDYFIFKKELEKLKPN